MPTVYVYTKDLHPEVWATRNERLREHYKIPEDTFQTWNCLPGCHSGCHKGGEVKCYMCYIFQDVSGIMFANVNKRKRGELV